MLLHEAIHVGSILAFHLALGIGDAVHAIAANEVLVDVQRGGEENGRIVGLLQIGLPILHCIHALVELCRHEKNARTVLFCDILARKGTQQRILSILLVVARLQGVLGCLEEGFQLCGLFGLGLLLSCQNREKQEQPQQYQNIFLHSLITFHSINVDTKLQKKHETRMKVRHVLPFFRVLTCHTGKTTVCVLRGSVRQTYHPRTEARR